MPSRGLHRRRRRPRGLHRRRRARQLRLLAAASAVLVLAAGGAAWTASDRPFSPVGLRGGVAPAARGRTGTPRAEPARPRAPSGRAPAVTSTTVAPTTTVDPGTLPQTMVLPPASGPVFDANVDALWSAIVQGNPALAMGFFFPLSAYVQVKAIADPQEDWQNRLVADFDSDIESYHADLGDAASTAQLVGVDVPESQAEWILPGVEYNSGSYYRVYDSTIDYTVNGQPGSFPIASMISWRGVWYVVHLASIR